MLISEGNPHGLLHVETRFFGPLILDLKEIKDETVVPKLRKRSDDSRTSAQKRLSPKTFTR